MERVEPGGKSLGLVPAIQRARPSVGVAPVLAAQLLNPEQELEPHLELKPMEPEPGAAATVVEGRRATMRDRAGISRSETSQ